MSSPSWKPHLAVLSANLFFGINFLLVKYVVPVPLAAITLNILRVCGAVILFWALFALNPSKPGVARQDLPRLLICALSGVVLNQILFVKGLSLTTTTHASLLILATPIVITFIAALVFKERITTVKIGGLLLGIAGASILILMRDQSHNASNMLLGDILVILNAVCYAFYLVWVRPLMHSYSAVHVIRWVFTIGMVFMVPYGWTEMINENWSAISPSQWIAIGTIVICGTFFAYLFNIYAVKKIGPSATGAYIYTQPVFGTILATLFAGEMYNVLHGLAAILIFTGVYLANFCANARE
jgi:drug/metabolite transporter (DMT)-like permease